MHHIFLSTDNITLSSLHQACFSHGWNTEDCAELLAGKGSHCWFLTEDSVPVAFLLTRLLVDEAEILAIGVLPGNRGKGYSRALLEYGLARLGKAGANKVFLEVRADNIAALTLYERTGFIRQGMRRNYYRADGDASRDALIYVKEHI